MQRSLDVSFSKMSYSMEKYAKEHKKYFFDKVFDT